ncbi:MAG: YXWGXW repeat-containing protein [Xanthomonadaceae bacterium]|nr:YXWGXW repeat-containing protein [Xanthomonadaceae bacterium]MDE1963392.1 YXWGXW repeat-containing protein [Xanthomonadaceae bacterium]
MSRLVTRMLLSAALLGATATLAGCIVVPARGRARVWVPGYWATPHVWVTGHWRVR